MRPLLVSEPRLVSGPFQGGITTRRGFPAAVRSGPDDPSRAEGRALLARILGIEESAMAWLHQVHGDRARIVDAAGAAGEGDALVTDRPGLALLVAVADCGPVLLHDPRSGVVAAAHAGWRGTVAGICERTVETMVGLGADASRVQAWIGPCIGPENFEVGPEVARQFAGEFVRRQEGRRPHVDLPAAIGDRLRDCGLQEAHIRIAGQCTMALEDRYWSYRRDGGICGRQIAWILRRRGPDV